MRKDDEEKKSYSGYLIAAFIGAAMVYVYLASREYSASLPADEKYRMICDACTIPGVLIFLSGVLSSLARRGSFDGIGYALMYTVRSLIPGNGGEKETYGEYLERKQAKSSARGGAYLFIVGGAFLFAAAVFFVLYTRAAA
ncbi:MAG: DUF3899 domain-containing protein [Firmicutes bacterium]|nr:DUF3899 domain-containing protein [Bacillota bacterium]